MAVTLSQIYLSVICGSFIIFSFVCNFTLLSTLIKLRRLNKSDKSNFFLTHLIFADFVSAFFILIPSGFGIYNDSYLSPEGCHVQLFFVTFFFSITFHGLMVLSIERYYKYKYPLSHINFFTKRTVLNEDGLYIPGKSLLHKTLIILLAIWLVDIFIGLIPLFQNLNDVLYFSIQSQCDYKYENFTWWLWFFFWVSLTVPFLISVIFFSLTLKLIYKNAVVINNRQNVARNNMRQKAVVINPSRFFCELFFPSLNKRQRAAEKYVNEYGKECREHRSGHKVSDTTKLPENVAFYSHIINVESIDNDQENIYNDIHVRKQLLIQFKYDTEKSKTVTFFIITIISYCLVFPVFVIHFYRTYKFNGTKFDNPDVVTRATYTTFVWISYITLFIKSLICLLHNKFYRYSLYQAAQLRGFHGDFDYEVEKFKKEIKMFQNRLNQPESKKSQNKKLIDNTSP